MSFRLGDDGTMDTVVVCEDCGAELRYNYEPAPYTGDDPGSYQSDEQAYDDFVAWAIADAEEEHSCGVDFDRSPSGWEEN